MSTLGRYVAWTPATEGSRRRAVPPVPLPRLTGAAWLAWRRNRALYRIFLVLLLGLALWVVWEDRELLTGMHHYAGECRKAPRSCDRYGSGYGPQAAQPAVLHVMVDKATSALEWVPVVVGAFLGGPLFAQDLESGTHRLAWSQSVGRRQWAGAKLAVAGTVTVLGTVLLSVAVSSWWLLCWRGQQHRGVDGAAWQSLTEWGTWPFYSDTGPVAVAHALLALLIGATAGLLIRRTLPAVAVAGGVCEGVLLGLDHLRPGFLPTSTLTGHNYPSLPRDAWYIKDGFVAADGSHLSSTTCLSSYSPNIDRCLGRRHVVGHFTDQHKMDQFLPMQGIETAICLAAAAALAAFCLWYVRRITAR